MTGDKHSSHRVFMCIKSIVGALCELNLLIWLCNKSNDYNQPQLFFFFWKSCIPLTMSISFSRKNNWVLSMITMVGPHFDENCTTNWIQNRKINLICDSMKQSTNLPKLINRPYLCLNAMHQRAIPSIQIMTQT